MNSSDGRIRAPARLRRHWAPAGAVLAVLLIVTGCILIAARHHTTVNSGSVPTAQRPAIASISSRAPVTHLSDASTVTVRVRPGGSASPGKSAPTAPTPVGTNVLPIHVVRLRIAAQQIDAPVVDVHVGADGLEIPPDPKVLGRWDGGANPGEPYGSVVLAGHVDNNSVLGALFHLSKLPIGSTVVAVGADGRGVAYRITGLREVPKLDLTSLDVFSQTTEARLVLITCGGSFNWSTHSYADNIVAFAVPTATG